MKLLFFIALTQLFIVSIIAASCTVVVQAVGSKITLDVTDGGNCYTLAKDTATRVVRIDGVQNQGDLAAYNGANCGGDEVKSGQSPLVFKNPVIVRSVRVNSCT